MMHETYETMSPTGNISVSHYPQVPKKWKAGAHRIATWCFRTFASRRSFEVRGQAYRYFYHPYNNTYSGERCVEVPLVLALLNEGNPGSLLEVGNVLQHYTKMKHDVVDKYESSSNIICCDILDYRPQKLYQRIVSISTIEHIGWDEPITDLEKPARVLEHLRSLLEKGGQMIVTAPTGYNPAVDEGFRSGRFRFDHVMALRRLHFSTWQESTLEEALSCEYGKPFPYGNAVLVAVVNQTGRS